MPRFLRRIFNPTSNPFRSTPTPSPEADVQRSRRVLVRSSTGALESSWRLSLFDAGHGHEEEHVALRDGGASLADSDLHKPILASQQEPERAQPRTRRRLSKKHRRPA
ncbi:hypothetical protein NX059_011255 [Plenodomus lindquistii]|nr:hypothetical protein NX059_011255 [Plenodomus lindquistii]